jgi:D-alanyl-D-alanine carboxypeptidase (penicillin-binding protein 5/6)
LSRRLATLLVVVALAGTAGGAQGVAATGSASASPGGQGARLVADAGTSTGLRVPPALRAPAAAAHPPRLSRHVRIDPARVLTVHRTRFEPTGRVPAPPRVRLRAWAVADMDSGAVLAVHHPRRHLPQASTIKLLTAVTAARTVAPRPDHRVTRAEAYPESCTCAGLLVHRRYTRAALLTGLLLPSGNDAAEALAGSHPDGRAAFIAAMNATARKLGAKDTRVVTPSGLTARGAYSSARDLLVFLRAAQGNRVVEPFLEMATGEVGPRHGRSHTVYRGTDYVNRYPAAQGKSGYTSAARNTLVVATPVRTGEGRRRIGVATLGAPGGAYSMSGTRALTMWAARSYGRLRSLGTLPDAPGPVVGAQAPAAPRR